MCSLHDITVCSQTFNTFVYWMTGLYDAANNSQACSLLSLLILYYRVPTKSCIIGKNLLFYTIVLLYPLFSIRCMHECLCILYGVAVHHLPFSVHMMNCVTFSQDSTIMQMFIMLSVAHQVNLHELSTLCCILFFIGTII
jgi:hypothetical protein